MRDSRGFLEFHHQYQSLPRQAKIFELHREDIDASRDVEEIFFFRDRRFDPQVDVDTITPIGSMEKNCIFTLHGIVDFLWDQLVR